MLHGNLIKYEIEYRRVECNESDPVSVADHSWKSVNVTNTALRAEIGSLVFWSCYEVRMRAVTVGIGPYSGVMRVRTNEHGELLAFGFCYTMDCIECTSSKLMDIRLIPHMNDFYWHSRFLMLQLSIESLLDCIFDSYVVNEDCCAAIKAT